MQRIQHHLGQGGLPQNEVSLGEKVQEQAGTGHDAWRPVAEIGHELEEGGEGRIGGGVGDVGQVLEQVVVVVERLEEGKLLISFGEGNLLYCG